jgi:hypothetical protein
MGLLDNWDVSREELNRVLDENPSLRGMLFGYVAELKLAEILEGIPGVTSSMKYDDHDRAHKGDRFITYRGQPIHVESKSLQSNSIRFDAENNRFIGRAQVDASDRRTLILPSGEQLTTTCLLRGEFDLLAVNVFAFQNKWKFAFAKNTDLPCSTFRGYTEAQRAALLATLVTVTWPPEPPFYSDPIPLLDDLVRARAT